MLAERLGCLRVVLFALLAALLALLAAQALMFVLGKLLVAEQFVALWISAPDVELFKHHLDVAPDRNEICFVF